MSRTKSAGSKQKTEDETTGVRRIKYIKMRLKEMNLERARLLASGMNSWRDGLARAK